MEIRDDQFLWVEKYRPQKIDDCVLPESLKTTFKQFITQGEIPSFLFTGTAGVGKTTVAKALCNEVGAEYMFINGSEESGIDVLRMKIKSFASSVSLTDAKKVVILDEADYLNANSTQPALRGFIETGALFGRLEPLASIFGERRIVDEIRKHLLVVVKERFHIHDQILLDRQTQDRFNSDVCAHIAHEGLARQHVAPVDAHRVRAAHAMRARTTER